VVHLAIGLAHSKTKPISLGWRSQQNGHFCADHELRPAHPPNGVLWAVKGFSGRWLTRWCVEIGIDLPAPYGHSPNGGWHFAFRCPSDFDPQKHRGHESIKYPTSTRSRPERKTANASRACSTNGLTASGRPGRSPWRRRQSATNQSEADPTYHWDGPFDCWPRCCGPMLECLAVPLSRRNDA
jgi:hypothetical protein